MKSRHIFMKSCKPKYYFWLLPGLVGVDFLISGGLRNDCLKIIQERYHTQEHLSMIIR